LRADSVGAWPGALATDIEREGATDLATAFARGEGDHASIAENISFNRRFIDMSEGVVVHNAWSWNRVRATGGCGRQHFFMIPMGVPIPVVEPIPTARLRLGVGPDDFVVVTLGEVTASKRIDRLIEAAAALPERIRERLQLLIVGDVTEASRRQLLEVARESGVTSQIRFTGRVSLEQLALFGRAADACVQLRYPARGETSAALLRALAAGSACVVSDAGSFGEVTDAAALRVRTPEHEVEDLTGALVRLHDDADLTSRLRSGAVRFIEQAHGLDAAAQKYAAAIRLTVARRRRDDGEWRDAARAALQTAAQYETIDDERLRRWADVRVAARAVQSGLVAP
jgi:glycosyltransferase involved in cell wall biosynthesis